MKLQWKLHDRGMHGFRDQMALYRDGILAATYRPFGTFVAVTEHVHGNAIPRRTLHVAGVAVARRVCRQIAEGTYPPVAETEPTIDGDDPGA